MISADLLQAIAAFGVAIAPAVTAVFLVRRRLTSRLGAASLLVLWGLFIVVAEHAGFGSAGFGGFQLRTHTGFHFQMLAGYGLAAFALVGIVIAPLIRRGDRMGWFGLLVVVVIGVGAEVATAVATTPHGAPPRWWSVGVGLWGYPVAWVTALALSFGPIFRSHDLEDTPGPRSEESDRRR